MAATGSLYKTGFGWTLGLIVLFALPGAVFAQQTIEKYTSTAALNLNTGDVTSFSLDGITYTFNIANNNTVAPDGYLQGLPDETSADNSLVVDQDEGLGIGIFKRIRCHRVFPFVCTHGSRPGSLKLTVRRYGNPPVPDRRAGHGHTTASCLTAVRHQLNHGPGEFALAGPLLALPGTAAAISRTSLPDALRGLRTR